MRCFIGFRPDQNSLIALVNFQKKLKKENSFWRFVPEEKLHLTFLFLGNNVTLEDINLISEKLSQICSSYKTFEAKCVGFGAFPKDKFATVLFCGLQSENLNLLAEKIREELASLSFKDNKPFKPHITIARSSKKLNASDLVKRYSTIVWNEKNCAVDHISIFRSNPTSQGYVYEVIKNFKIV
ncbi:MAG: RNA 2',3'-cyclic phosphodiesterase [Candidatus Micrarchaeota archaeon]|nr:RNA 2',3'-cyclic phosphodiesterase [Candidatus Micrarchaeota archaeon]